MKKICIIAIGFLAFACTDSTEKGTNTEGTDMNNNTEESVEIGSGEEISPQLDIETDSSARLDVDTISSSTEANEQR